MAEKKAPGYKGIVKKTKEGLAELKHTLVQFPHLEEIYFTAAGEHFFNAHELKERGKTTRLYGYQNVVPTLAKVLGERRFYKNKSVHTPETHIVQTMTAEEVLDYEWVEAGEDEAPNQTLKEQRQLRKDALEAKRKIAEIGK